QRLLAISRRRRGILPIATRRATRARVGRSRVTSCRRNVGALQTGGNRENGGILCSLCFLLFKPYLRAWWSLRRQTYNYNMAAGIAPTFACDVMLGALARWLRAAGYDAWWSNAIDDWDLVRLAQREGRILLSADTGIFRIGIVRDGDVPALQVPNGLTVQEQLAFV